MMHPHVCTDPQYAHNDGAPHVQNIYHNNNSQTMVWGNDREMMTSDAGGGVYAGMVKAQSADAPLRIELATTATGTQPGGALCVLSGISHAENSFRHCFYRELKRRSRRTASVLYTSTMSCNR